LLAPKKWRDLERAGSDKENATVAAIKYETLYDGTLQTFELMKTKNIHDVWKEFEKMQKMSSI
jgi:hypothetical protein